MMTRIVHTAALLLCFLLTGGCAPDPAAPSSAASSGSAADAALAGSYYGRAVAHVRGKRYEEAIADYDKAIELQPNYAQAIEARAIAYVLKREFDKAILDYSRAIELLPAVERIYYNRAMSIGRSRTMTRRYGSTRATRRR